MIEPDSDACVHEVAHALVAHRLGLLVTELWVKGCDGFANYQVQLRDDPTIEERARFHGSGLVVTVAGFVGEMLAKDIPNCISRDDRLNHLLNAEAISEFCDEPCRDWPAGEDSESTVLRVESLVSGGVCRKFLRDPRDDPGARGDISLARFHAGELLLVPPSAVAAVPGFGPGTDWLGSPHGAGVALIRKAEDEAERILRADWRAVEGIAGELAHRRGHRLSGDQFWQLAARYTKPRRGRGTAKV